MNTRTTAMKGAGVALLLGFACAGSAVGQEQMDSRGLPPPDVDAASCDKLAWHQDLLGKYPWVIEACHEVVLVDGEKWARFEADFERLNRDGSITSEFKNRQGMSRGRMALMPGPDQRVMLDGKPYRFSELTRGQTLNFYVPEGMYAFSAEPNSRVEQRVTVVDFTDEPETTDEPGTTYEPSVQLAQAETSPAPVPYRLPETAGPLPVIALAGVLSLLGGLGLRIRRRFANRTK